MTTVEKHEATNQTRLEALKQASKIRAKAERKQKKLLQNALRSEVRFKKDIW